MQLRRGWPKPPLIGSWTQPALISLGLLLPILILYAEVLFGGKTLVPYDALALDPAFQSLLAERGVQFPQNGLLADLVLQNLVWKDFWRDAVLAGAAPLWNPLILGGLPFLAAGQASPLYPTSLLFLALPADLAFGPAAAMNLWVAALAMFALGRALRLGNGPSAVMAVTWSLSTLFVANTVFPMIQAAMAWTPLLLAALESMARQLEAGRRGWLPTGVASLALIVVALSTAFIALAGHPEMLYYAGLTAVTFAGFRALLVASRRRPGDAARFLVWGAAAGATGLLVAAIQLVPLVELARTSFRADTAYADAVQHSFSIRQAVTFISPNFYGNPAHHDFWDVTRRSVASVDSDTMWGTTYPSSELWGPTKNYVEAAAYVGLLPLLLAAVGLVSSRRRERWYFAGLGALAASFVFGLPTYRLLFLLPGIEQLRTPFRWVFPLALAVTVLAGIGAERITWRRPSRVARGMGLGALMAGAAGMGILVASYVAPARWTAAVATGLGLVPGARDAALERFATIAEAAGYLYLQAAHLAVFLALGGVALLLAIRTRGSRLGWLLTATVIAADLLVVGRGFNPAVDPDLGELRPPSVLVLQDAVDVKWGRVVGLGEAKVFWPNTLMRFDVPDLRGYDSIIPEWTAATISSIEDQSGWLQFNRVGNLEGIDSLNDPALLAAGGRYVVTNQRLEADGLTPIYEGDVSVYENIAAMPRAWVVASTRVVSDRAALLDQLAALDVGATALLEEPPDEDVWQQLAPGRALPGPTQITAESANELEIDVYSPASGLLVVSEAWFPGWRAFVSTASGEGTRDEIEVPVYRVNGMLRGIPVPAGRSAVSLSYFPMSVKIGIYGSFLGLLLVFLGAAYAGWVKVIGAGSRDQVRTVAVNSIGPMGAALLNKVVDFAFAMLMLRILGPENAGRYYTAIIVISFAEIFTNFGLNLFTTREVAREPGRAPIFLAQTSVIRLGLWILSLPVLVGYVLYRAAAGAPLTTDTILAIGLLALALVPGSFNTAITSVFQAFERMMLPAGVTIVSNFVRVSAGALVLLLGWGFVGLAAVAIAVNWLTFGILAVLLVREGVSPELRWRPSVAAGMAAVSLPFMLNHLLQTVFFKIDVLLLSQMRGDAVVGWYSAAYKWIDALLIVPAYFTMAIFPMMSRRASDDKGNLRDTYVLSMRWLLSLALPIAMGTTFISEPLIRLLAGEDFLPAGAVALQIMIWFLPLSFANGLTQYVLLALDRQKWITPSFAVAVTFNVAANLWAIPRYGYQGAAVVTIFSEMALLVPFWWGIRDLGAPSVPAMIWRPALATSLMGASLVGLDSLGLVPLASTFGGMAAYVAGLRIMGGFTPEDRRILTRLLGRPA